MRNRKSQWRVSIRDRREAGIVRTSASIRTAAILDGASEAEEEEEATTQGGNKTRTRIEQESSTQTVITSKATAEAEAGAEEEAVTDGTIAPRENSMSTLTGQAGTTKMMSKATRAAGAEAVEEARTRVGLTEGRREQRQSMITTKSINKK